VTTIWNQHLLTSIANGNITFTAGNLGLTLVYSYAVPTNTSPDNINQLLLSGGFQELVPATGYTRLTRATNTTVTSGLTKVVIGADYALTLTAPTYVAAAVFYIPGTQAGLTDSWLFITDDMFGNVVSPGAVLGVASIPKAIFSFVTRGSGATVTADMALGALVQSPGPTAWESARIQHVYLYPQRVNYLPNPSYEDVGGFGWRSDAALTRVVGGVDNAANYFGRTAGKVVQSIAVPTQGRMRFSIYVRKGTGTHVTLGLVCLDTSYNTLTTVQGVQRPLYGDWARYDDLLTPSDDSQVVIPQISADGTFDFDLGLLEATDPLHDYFDGDSSTGAAYDFSWQGPEAQSYSCFYNNRYVTAARLFGGYFDGQVTKPCLVQDWVPSATAVFTHWDVLSVNDTKPPLKDWNPKIFVP
jgi:hypothetical protein